MPENEVHMEYHVDEAIAELGKKAQEAMVKVGIQAEGYAKLELENSPRRIDTGRLRNSITYATSSSKSSPEDPADSDDGVPETPSDDRSVYIGTNVEYAAEIHEGRKGLDPNRFLRNAVERNQEEYRSIIDETLKGD